MADPKPDQAAQLKLVKQKDLQQVVLQPSVRVSTNWTPARIRAVMRSADGGHLHSAADLCDVILADDRAKAGFGSRTAGLLGLPEEFEAVELPRGEAAAEALEEDWPKAFPDDEAGQILKWGAMLGVAPYQHLWKTLLNGRTVPGIKFWHPRHLHWNWQTRLWMVRTEKLGDLPIEPGDGKWGLYCPYGTDRPWAEGLWRGLALWWLVKQFARDDWARFGEAAATRVVTSPAASATSMQDNRKQVASELESMGADGSIALPPGFDIKILEARADTAKIYKDQIAMANMAFDIAIKGQNLTTEVGGGSRSAAEVHERVQDTVVRWDGERFSQTLREQSTVWWAEFNFGDGRLAPEQSWDTEPAEDINDRADRFKVVAEGIAALKGAGFEVDPEQIEEDFELRLTRVEPSAAIPNPGPGPADANARATIAASEAYARTDGDSSGTVDGLPLPRLPAESSDHDEDDDALAQTTVQTLIFRKPKFTVATAKSWARRHDFRNDKVDETDASIRLRQRTPSDFQSESFRTITLTEGVQAVIGKLKDSVARVASGYHAQTQGFLDGQEYTDRLIGFGRRLTPEMHANFVGRLINLIDDHDNLEDLKAAAVLLFQDEMPPEELAALMENLFVLGELAGMQAVNEDT